ncbi:MAG TPA: amylo-alpha-1,6-glucosidase [Bryobacteraceae bacterium]|nr:amylo-alpha-1,6-glucosidase [Bryobacteraceae bacterium]
MLEPVRVLPRRTVLDPDADPHLNEEWLLTNGIGGYASGTVSGVITRRYHGLLIAALPNPHGRTMMLDAVSERLRAGLDVVYAGIPELTGAKPGETLMVSEFRLEGGLPVWRYASDHFVMEKRLIMPFRQNTVYILYTLLEPAGPVRLGIRPALHFRPHDSVVNVGDAQRYVVTAHEGRYEICGGSDLPPLRMLVYGTSPALSFDPRLNASVFYSAESNRGYESHGWLWSPGYIRLDLSRDSPAALVASTEDWDTIHALTPQQAFSAEMERRRLLLRVATASAGDSAMPELVLAADQFLITPMGRPEDAARARASGDEIRTVIAGYHWFTDWGRDTMISLEGLALCTGRRHEAGWILRTFAHYIRDGLIPNLFPEGKKEGLYHTADATLWFFHTLQRYLEATDDRPLLYSLLPKITEIIRWHLRGTRFGIHVDPADGLLVQGAKGYQLTWMDAKVGDWVVTPRRGKAVEINALWYNALVLAERWLEEESQDVPSEFREAKQRARESFNQRFWNAAKGYLFDVVDGEQGGNDDSCRPNQIFAVSLDYPVLSEQYWMPVVQVVKDRLLTPRGLRSLAPGEPDFKAKYYGDLRARDAAYHQGTVWAWLIGPFVDAWLRVHPGDVAGARQCLEGLVSHLGQACIGSISEIFDAEPPYTPRGCIAQAWSVAELLRAWVKTAPKVTGPPSISKTA